MTTPLEKEYEVHLKMLVRAKSTGQTPNIKSLITFGNSMERIHYWVWRAYEDDFSAMERDYAAANQPDSDVAAFFKREAAKAQSLLIKRIEDKIKIYEKDLLPKIHEEDLLPKTNQ